MKGTVVLLSGGMDSTTLLYHLLKTEDKKTLAAISFNYGQRHRKEIAQAQEIAYRHNVPHTTIDLKNLKPILKGSALTDDSIEVPEGHYEAESMKQTVVPNRNLIMLTIASSMAISLKYSQVAYAAHSGDHAIYPDCRKEFIDKLKEVFELSDWHKIKLSTPFIAMTKAEIAKHGHELGVPYHLTWSCYKGRELHCGKCGTCVERRSAFIEANIPDPTEYEANAGPLPDTPKKD